MTRGEATMKLRTHVALALLQFLSACVGMLCLLALWELYIWAKHGYEGLFYLMPEGEALLGPMLAIEGLVLGAIPSYVFVRRILETRLPALINMPVALGIGFIQGVLFPLILVAVGWMIAKAWVVAYWFGIQHQQATGLTDAFWWFLAFLLALAAIASAVAAALLMRKLLMNKRDEQTGRFP
jgi:hypothetical protein